jgi:hypothetical protein
MVLGSARVVGLDKVRAKLALMPLHVQENNTLMIESMLAWIKAETIANTPLGPGHFGYHLRNSITTKVEITPTKVKGFVRAPVQGYWREYGTLGRLRHGASVAKARRALALVVGYAVGSSGGERPRMTAHKAATGAKKIINAFYSHALWWRL